MTEKLYFTDNSKLEFESNVISCNKNSDNTFNLILDKTFFYPEGGGQPADRGFISNLEVLDVQKDGEFIIHVLKQKIDNKTVKCKINKEHREHFMCQHTGQHLISGVLKREYNIDTKSVHLGNKVTTIEINKPELSIDDLKSIENSCNDLIKKSKKIISHFTDDDNLSNFDIRRSSKVQGSIRVMEIEGYDWVPCGGVHLGNTSSIGLIKLLSIEKIRSNIRLKFLIGKDAYSDYQQKHDLITKINQELSTKDYEALDGVVKLKEKISNLKLDLKNITDYLRKSIINELSHFQDQVKIYEDLPKGIIKTVVPKLRGTLLRPLLIIEVNEKVNWYLIDSIEKRVNFKVFSEKYLPIINGKGGGKEIWQGSGEKMKIMEFAEKTSNYLAIN